MAELIGVQVAYARPDVQVVKALSVPVGTRARAALRLSGLGTRFPEIDLDRCALGIHGREINGDGHGGAQILRHRRPAVNPDRPDVCAQHMEALK